MPIRLLLIDDHRLLLESWKAMFEKGGEFTVEAIATTPEEAKELSQSLAVDVIICDINLGSGNESGFSVVPVIHVLNPHARILAVSMYSAPAIAKKMFRLGASGYVSKNSPFEELTDAVKIVHQGQRYLCKTVQEMILGQYVLTENTDEKKVASLTERELLIMQFIREGFSSKEIAVHLDVSVKTIETHRSTILKKLGTPNVAGLVSFMNKHGLLLLLQLGIDFPFT